MCGDGKEAFRFICFDESCNDCEYFKSNKCDLDRPRPTPMPAYGRD